MSRILVSLCLLFAACGEVVPVKGDDGDGGASDDGGANDPDATPVDPCEGPEIKAEDLEGCFLKMMCQYNERCEAGFPDAAFCEENLFDYELTSSNGATGGGDDGPPSPLMLELIRRAATQEGLNYNGDKAYQCLVSQRDRSCKGRGSNRACENLVTGTVGEGGDCVDSFECLEGAKCDRDENDPSCSNLGSCRMGLLKGADCVNASNDCQQGLKCVDLSANSGSVTCEDGSFDSPCSENRECGDGLFCNLGTSKCRDARESGATCGLNAECPDEELCVFGKCRSVSQAGADCEDACYGKLFCNPSNKCQAFPGENQDCVMVPADESYRCASVKNICDVQSTQTCIPRILVSATCPVGAGDSCALGTFCSGELNQSPAICTAPGATGAFCITAKHCASGYCEPGTTPASNACADYVACWESS